MILVNGEPESRISVEDRGFNYGDGVFETMRIQDGEIPLLALHLARARGGCRRLGLGWPGEETLRAELEQVVGQRDRGVAKLVLSRGTGSRGYRPEAGSHPTRVIRSCALPPYPESNYSEGISAAVCATRLGRNPGLGGLKHLGRLEQVLASMEPATADHAEGLMLDTRGNLIEGIRSNVFLLLDGVLTTPEVDQSGVAGVMRDVILQEAPSLDIPVGVREIPYGQSRHAGELFVCNSVFGIWGIRAVADQERSWPVGPVTRKLMKWAATKGVAEWAG